MTMHGFLPLLFAPSGQQGGAGLGIFVLQIAAFIRSEPTTFWLAKKIA